MIRRQRGKKKWHLPGENGMIGTMARIRVFFDSDEELKLAIQMEALRQDVSASQLIETVLREHFADSLKEAQRTIAQRKPKK
jgi:hypothetical protein